MMHLIGIPYEKKDCWALAREFYQSELGVELKHYFDGPPPDRKDVEALIYSNRGDFVKVEDGTLEYGDLILLKIFGVECHISVYIGKGQMLHTTRGSGSVIDRLSRWGKMISGVYRLPETK